MFQLRCTVRGCAEPLTLQDSSPATLRCSRGHCFDQAKQGYWNLLQPQDRKSANPGDSDDAVSARHRWLQRGHMSGLIDTLRPWLQKDQSFRTMDLGCGEGTFGTEFFSNTNDTFCGIDLSKRAIKLAARLWPQATWVLANADRILPAHDASVDQVLTLFGRRPVSEIDRVLKPGGHLIVAVPGEEDLIELREQVQQAGHRRSRWEKVVDEFVGDQPNNSSLELVQHASWSHTVDLDAESIADALAMTYRGVRHSQRERIESLTNMKVTLAADLIQFRKN